MSMRPCDGAAPGLGLALYTVRDACAADLAGTLEAVAAMGYEGVELHDLYGHSADEVAGLLDAAGLAVVGRHVSLGALERSLDALAADAAALGSARIVLGWIEPPADDDGARRLAAVLEEAREEAAALDLELGFHNHDGELLPLDRGESFLDHLLRTGLFLELDLGWAWWAGVDPAQLVERVGARAPLLHVKDFRTRGERSFCPVGDGAVGYAQVAAVAARRADWLLVEQDETNGSSVAAARRSLDALRAIVRPA